MNTAPTTPTPPQGLTLPPPRRTMELTDKEITDAMPKQLHEDLAKVCRMASDSIGVDVAGMFRVCLNRGIADLCRAAIADDRANHFRDATKMALSAEEVDARFRAWWAESYPNAPAGTHAVQSHVAFALHLMGGEGAA